MYTFWIYGLGIGGRWSFRWGLHRGRNSLPDQQASWILTTSFLSLSWRWLVRWVGEPTGVGHSSLRKAGCFLISTSPTWLNKEGFLEELWLCAQSGSSCSRPLYTPFWICPASKQHLPVTEDSLTTVYPSDDSSFLLFWGCFLPVGYGWIIVLPLQVVKVPETLPSVFHFFLYLLSLCFNSFTCPLNQHFSRKLKNILLAIFYTETGPWSRILISLGVNIFGSEKITFPFCLFLMIGNSIQDPKIFGKAIYPILPDSWLKPL